MADTAPTSQSGPPLGEHFDAFIRNQLATGRYATAQEVLREALRLLEQREAELEWLRAAIQEGDASPLMPPIDRDAWFAARRRELER